MSVLYSIASIFHWGRRSKIREDTLCGWNTFLILVKITLQWWVLALFNLNVRRTKKKIFPTWILLVLWLVLLLLSGSFAVLSASFLYSCSIALVSNKAHSSKSLFKFMGDPRQNTFHTCMSTLRNRVGKKKSQLLHSACSASKVAVLEQEEMTSHISAYFGFCYSKRKKIKCFCSAWLYSNVQLTQLSNAQWNCI